MPKILVVDDDQTTASLLKTLLELHGYSVVHAWRGADVLPLTRAQRPDVILMDVHLADANGMELLKEIRASGDTAATRVIMSSGMDVEDQCRAAGADAFILKPYAPGELSSTIREVLDA